VVRYAVVLYAVVLYAVVLYAVVRYAAGQYAVGIRIRDENSLAKLAKTPRYTKTSRRSFVTKIPPIQSVDTN
jgi:hypothetical protein